MLHATHGAHLEKRRSCEHRVTACLVHLPHAMHVQVVGNVLETAFQRPATLHEVFHIVKDGEVDPGGKQARSGNSGGKRY